MESKGKYRHPAPFHVENACFFKAHELQNHGQAWGPQDSYFSLSIAGSPRSNRKHNLVPGDRKLGRDPFSCLFAASFMSNLRCSKSTDMSGQLFPTHPPLTATKKAKLTMAAMADGSLGVAIGALLKWSWL